MRNRLAFVPLLRSFLAPSERDRKVSLDALPEKTRAALVLCRAEDFDDFMTDLYRDFAGYVLGTVHPSPLVEPPPTPREINKLDELVIIPDPDPILVNDAALGSPDAHPSPKNNNVKPVEGPDGRLLIPARGWEPTI